MQLEEYYALERVEDKHWFYTGKRELVSWWITRSVTLRSGDRILDAGAGTGALVKELREKFAYQGVTVDGVEYMPEARTIAQEQKGISLRAGSILELPAQDNTYTVSIALDVLEHVEDDATALHELIRVTKPGGIVIINVPALMSLWSDWDVTLGHYRRYTKKELSRLLSREQNIDILFFQYANAFAFLPVWAYRKVARLFNLKSRAEDVIPSAWLNKLLKFLFVSPAKQPWFRAPFGVSLFCVLRKK